MDISVQKQFFLCRNTFNLSSFSPALLLLYKNHYFNLTTWYNLDKDDRTLHKSWITNTLMWRINIWKVQLWVQLPTVIYHIAIIQNTILHSTNFQRVLSCGKNGKIFVKWIMFRYICMHVRNTFVLGTSLLIKKEEKN